MSHKIVSLLEVNVGVKDPVDKSDGWRLEGVIIVHRDPYYPKALEYKVTKELAYTFIEGGVGAAELDKELLLLGIFLVKGDFKVAD